MTGDMLAACAGAEGLDGPAAAAPGVAVYTVCPAVCRAALPVGGEAGRE